MTGLPVQLTSFVGRRAELTELRRLASENRLLTLIGGPGIGKSRLAQELATSLAPAADLAYVAVSAVTDPGLLALEIAAALDVPPDRLLAELRTRRHLVVLDGCERLIDGSAELADGLLRQAPLLSLLATSREPLGVPGEVTARIPPLRAEDARELFEARLAQARPDFRITEANRALLDQVCEGLGGVPLALELGAVRLRTMSLEDIHERLPEWLRLLTGGWRTGEPRQRTMRAAITWSFELLEPAEKALLARLSIFAGSFRLSAAEDVCAFPPLERAAVLPALTGLVEKSLAVHTDSGYQLPETVRQFAAEQLVDLGQEMDARARHADFHLALAESGRAGPTDAANLGVALDWAQRYDAGRHLRLASALVPHWLARGAIKEAHTRLRAALDQVAEAGPAHAQARRRLAALTQILTSAGDLRDLREAFLAAGGDGAEMDAVATGAAALAEGELARATECFGRPLSERVPATIAIQGLAVIAARRRDHERALRLDGAARAEMGRLGLRLPLQSLDDSEGAVGRAAARDLRARGARMSFDEALELAAGEPRPGDLTERELEIARLVAEGLTNRQIGARLHLSVRTVEGHVEHLRQKLGFATRAKVAAWFAEKQVANT